VAPDHYARGAGASPGPKPSILGLLFQRLNAAIEAAKLKIPTAESFPLLKAAKAHERLAEGHVLGKIVLRTGKP
jgi:NADPH:quinone reductase-like Zn-dependent oxidoreductase